MTRTMRHRGPDDEGYQLFPNGGLGFQRLSIIDLSRGHQPMTNEDGTLWVIFNGEIYNYQSLRAELLASGRHTFKTESDTEVIVHLFEEYGERCVEKLRGMFAFAIWDTKNESLFLARDRFGKKPLVYANLGNTFLFASEIKALLKHPEVKKDINYEAIDLYLSYQYIPSPHTIFKSIHKLQPAHTMTVTKDSIRSRCYWRPNFQQKTNMSFHEAQTAMMDKLKEATKIRMIADVPLGAFLSGGKDSSVIVGLMSELSSQPIKTFSIGFEEAAFSELPYAKLIADRFHCDHHEFIVRPNMVDVLPKLAWHYSEPFGDSSALPSYYVSQLSRQFVTVALNGDGGDETMAGYPRYQAMKIIKTIQKIPLPLRKAVFEAAKVLPDGIPPHSIPWRIKRLLGLGLQDTRTYYLDTMCFFREQDKANLYSASMREHIKNSYPPNYVNGYLQEASSLTDIDPYLYADLITYLPECLMTKMDVASMANSLESRSPFLDHEFVELVGTFPSDWKLKGLFHKKYILDKAVKKWIPKEILQRKKQGFALPMASWFRGSLYSYVKDMLTSKRALSRDLFNPEQINTLVEEHKSGHVDRSYQLWALLMLEQWYQVYFD